MSELSLHQQNHVSILHELYQAITTKNQAFETIRARETDISLMTPADIVVFVHELVISGQDMKDIRLGINKLLNVTYKAISNYPYYPPKKDSFPDICIQNNKLMVKIMEKIRPVLIAFNKDTENQEIRKELSEGWKNIIPFMNYYIIKENIMFPLIEKHIPAFKCIAVMWSFHDEIRRNLTEITDYLDAEKKIDLKILNRLAGDLFFNLYAVKFREERILFPVIEQMIEPELLDGLIEESIQFGFPYYNPAITLEKKPVKPVTDPGLIDLKTGGLSVEQIILIFKHLPVDLTYVDENNKVLFFSTPPNRIFPRTTAIIGRDVKNCHPHESVHVVEQIVDSFRKGTKNQADFWINMKGKRILIQYFAVRDDDGNYRGVLEASQVITEIQALTGEKRILDWQQE